MKKEIQTKNQIREAREKAILANFANNFNKIKRVNEDDLQSFDLSQNANPSGVNPGMNMPTHGLDPNYSNGIMGKLEYGILEGYLDAALFTNAEMLRGANINDLSDDARQSANDDVLAFMQEAGNYLNDIEPEDIGHDLWLTRNGHGAGFWDRGLGDVGDILTNIAQKMGPKDLYLGDDGQLYFS